MKICSRCKIEKNECEFNKKRLGLNSYCKDCNRSYLKNHYSVNTDYYKNKSKQSKRQHREFIAKYKNVPCADCKQTFHSCAMEFDHLPGSNKKFNVGQAGGRSKKQIIEEIDKCEVVCKVCHAYRTYERRTGINPRLTEE